MVPARNTARSSDPAQGLTAVAEGRSSSGGGPLGENGPRGKTLRARGSGSAQGRSGPGAARRRGPCPVQDVPAGASTCSLPGRGAWAAARSGHMPEPRLARRLPVRCHSARKRVPPPRAASGSARPRPAPPRRGAPGTGPRPPPSRAGAPGRGAQPRESAAAGARRPYGRPRTLTARARRAGSGPPRARTHQARSPARRRARAGRTAGGSLPRARTRGPFAGALRGGPGTSGGPAGRGVSAWRRRRATRRPRRAPRPRRCCRPARRPATP